MHALTMEHSESRNLEDPTQTAESKSVLSSASWTPGGHQEDHLLATGQTMVGAINKIISGHPETSRSLSPWVRLSWSCHPFRPSPEFLFTPAPRAIPRRGSEGWLPAPAHQT
jgi:hypothetical protein